MKVRCFVCFSFILLSLRISLIVDGQSDSIQNFYKNNFEINVTEIFFKDFRFSYDRIINSRNEINFSLGYKFPKDAQVIENNVIIPDYLDLFKHYKWFFGSIGYTFYSIKQFPFFFAIELYDMNKLYDKVYFWNRYEYEWNPRTYLTSEVRNLYGIKLLIGLKFNLFSKKNQINAVLKIFSGFGWRHQIIEVTKYGYANGYNEIGTLILFPEPHLDRTVMNFPTFHFGCKIGIAWGK